jgi:hypothetical protein
MKIPLLLTKLKTVYFIVPYKDFLKDFREKSKLEKSLLSYNQNRPFPFPFIEPSTSSSDMTEPAA